MRVYFVGAGPGDPELLTRKAERLLRSSRFCVYAGSLVSPAVLELLPAECERYDSATLTLGEIIALCERARALQADVVRLHTGDPSIYGAIREQMTALDEIGILYEIVPGVSSFQAAAAALRVELTVPEVSQTVILSRAAGRTPVPEREQLEHLANLQATLCLFLSVESLPTIARTLTPQYGGDCPAAVVFHASWPDQRVVRGTLSDIAERVAAAGIRRTAMICVGRALGASTTASKLYDAAFAHGYRPACGAVEAPPPCAAAAAGDHDRRIARIALITLSARGARVLARLADAIPGATRYVHRTASSAEADVLRFDRLAELTREVFSRYDGLVYVAPCGAVVRSIAPHLRHKTTDPAVVVVDVGARHAVSLLSGHERGANELALRVSNALGAEPVISTTTDALKDVIVGIGCRRGASPHDIENAVRAALEEAEVPLERVRFLASADLKAEEAGLFAAAAHLGVPVRLIASDEIRSTTLAFEHSEVAQNQVNLPAVAEPAALLAGRRTQFVLRRKIICGVTVAVAKEVLPWSESAPAAPSTALVVLNAPLPKAP